MIKILVRTLKAFIYIKKAEHLQRKDAIVRVSNKIKIINRSLRMRTDVKT